MLESKSELEIIEAFKELDANERGAVLHYLSENKRMHVLFEIQKMSEQRFQRRMEELGQWETILRERHGKAQRGQGSRLKRSVRPIGGLKVRMRTQVREGTIRFLTTASCYRLAFSTIRLCHSAPQTFSDFIIR
ncbi:hypothetical protein MPH_13878 [Macrophomina phaseolina MS6]|uniref:Uncharacterized protein n=1 Tax=Macrophomina phaseolina (strain MS6) TaxID=1126212 RepID=K2R4L3_MACPH|nr:hypothetical protein MPH_13878 [Macrophomina phaseolina MS6]